MFLCFVCLIYGFFLVATQHPILYILKVFVSHTLKENAPYNKEKNANWLLYVIFLSHHIWWLHVQ